MIKCYTKACIIAASLLTLPAAADTWGIAGRGKSLETGEPTINLFNKKTMSLTECKDWITSNPFDLGAGEVVVDGKMYVVNFKVGKVTLSCVSSRAALSGEERYILPLGLTIEE
jgi:hypothetical protein